MRVALVWMHTRACMYVYGCWGGSSVNDRVSVGGFLRCMYALSKIVYAGHTACHAAPVISACHGLTSAVCDVNVCMYAYRHIMHA